MIVRWARMAGIMLAVLAFWLCAAGCDGRADKNGEPDGGQPAGGVRNVPEWIDELGRAYAADGIEGFQAARRLMADDSALTDSLGYDTAAMVLGLGETGTSRKEVQLAAELRRLAEYIEQHPGQSHAEAGRLGNKLFSYWFGSSGIGMDDKDNVAIKLDGLYSFIAKRN